MKSFDEFLATQSEQLINESTKKALAQIPLSDTTYTEKDRALALLIVQATTIHVREFLRRYHEWLSEQMP